MSSYEQPPGSPGAPPPGGGGAGWEDAGFGTRVNEIVDAVEREASKLRQEAEQDAAQIRRAAEEEAQRYVDHARRQSEALVAQRTQEIRELSDALMARAEEVLERLEYAVPVKTGFENLVRALGETAEKLATQDLTDASTPGWEQARAAPDPAGYGGGATPPAPQGPPPAAGQPAVGTAPGSEQPTGGGWQQLDDAHRIAIQMAAAGSSRGEVEAHLAHAPAPARASVLDEIFGPGTPPETRVPWASPPR